MDLIDINAFARWISRLVSSYIIFRKQKAVATTAVRDTFRPVRSELARAILHQPTSARVNRTLIKTASTHPQFSSFHLPSFILSYFFLPCPLLSTIFQYLLRRTSTYFIIIYTYRVEKYIYLSNDSLFPLDSSSNRKDLRKESLVFERGSSGAR